MLPAMTGILVVEDDRALRAIVVGALETAGHTVWQAGDGLSAVEVARREAPDIVVLDLGLPVADGWHVLGELAGGPTTAVIVISARGDEAGKVRALDLGAEDYLAKPFGSDELLARVRAVLRRLRPSRQGASPAVAGDIVVDLSARRVTRGAGEVILSPTEYALLSELARRAGEVADHATLLAAVWGPSHVGERNYLRTFIQRLRLKLEEEPSNPRVIVTVGRLGYRFGDASS